MVYLYIGCSSSKPQPFAAKEGTMSVSIAHPRQILNMLLCRVDHQIQFNIGSVYEKDAHIHHIYCRDCSRCTRRL